MAGILHKQIDLKQTSPNTYSVSWDVDWTLGTNMTPISTLKTGSVTSTLQLQLSQKRQSQDRRPGHSNQL
jgi:hypothetical protein